jgi:hypothetical protein
MGIDGTLMAHYIQESDRSYTTLTAQQWRKDTQDGLFKQVVAIQAELDRFLPESASESESESFEKLLTELAAVVRKYDKMEAEERQQNLNFLPILSDDFQHLYEMLEDEY